MISELNNIWEERQQAKTEPDKKEFDKKMQDLFQKNCASFGKQDSRELKALAARMKEETPELADKIAALAEVLVQAPEGSALSDLPQELVQEVIARIPIMGRSAIYTLNRAFREKMNEPFYLAAKIHEPEAPLSYDALKAELQKCGSYVVDLDLSRLLGQETRRQLDQEQLKGLLSLCSRLETVTLYQNEGLTKKDLAAILSSTIKKVYIAACPNIEELAAPEFLIEKGMKLSDYLEIKDPAFQSYLLKPPEALQNAIREGLLPARRLPQLNLRTVRRLVQTPQLLALGIPLEAFATLSSENQVKVGSRFGLVAQFLGEGMSLQKILRLSEPEIQELMHARHPVSEDLPLDSLFIAGQKEPFLALKFSDQMEVLNDFTLVRECLKKGMPLERFLELKHSTIFLVGNGMNFGEFLALSDEMQKKLLAHVLKPGLRRPSIVGELQAGKTLEQILASIR